LRFSAAILVAVVALSASADHRGFLGFSIAGEYAIPFGALGESVSPSPGVSAHLLFGLTETITADLGFSYFLLSESDEIASLPDPEMSLWTLDLSLRYTFDPDAFRFFPYISVGAGCDAVKWTLPDENGQAVVSSFRNFGLAGALGAAVKLGDTIYIDLGARANAIFTESETTTFVAPRLGALFFLGAN
jgi:hypothetical protein